MSNKVNPDKENKNDLTFKGTNDKHNLNAIHSQNFKKDGSIGNKIDQIFHDTHNINEIESKVILMLMKESKNFQAKQGSKDIQVDIAKDVSEVVKEIINNKKLETKNQTTIGSIEDADKTDEPHRLTEESKKFFKVVLKNFAVYEVYKIMNPRRIAGETAKDNYNHNMAIGGEKLASKHTGGKPKDVAKYSDKDIKSAKAFKKPEGWVR